jgi:hypothetical protein
LASGDEQDRGGEGEKERGGRLGDGIEDEGVTEIGIPVPNAR